MSAFRPFRRFSREDYPKATPWFLTYLDNINPMVDTLNSLLLNIDTTTNILCERQTVLLQHGVPFTLRLQKLKVQPYLLRVGYAAGNIVSSSAITAYNTDGTIQITVNFIGAPTGVIPTLIVLEP